MRVAVPGEGGWGWLALWQGVEVGVRVLLLLLVGVVGCVGVGVVGRLWRGAGVGSNKRGSRQLGRRGEGEERGWVGVVGRRGEEGASGEGVDGLCSIPGVVWGDTGVGVRAGEGWGEGVGAGRVGVGVGVEWGVGVRVVEGWVVGEGGWGARVYRQMVHMSHLMQG